MRVCLAHPWPWDSQNLTQQAYAPLTKRRERQWMHNGGSSKRPIILVSERPRGDGTVTCSHISVFFCFFLFFFTPPHPTQIFVGNRNVGGSKRVASEWQKRTCRRHRLLISHSRESFFFFFYYIPPDMQTCSDGLQKGESRCFWLRWHDMQISPKVHLPIM